MRLFRDTQLTDRAEEKFMQMGREMLTFGLDINGQSIKLDANTKLDVDNDEAQFWIERVLKDEKLTLDWLGARDRCINALGFENVELPYGTCGYGHAKNHYDIQMSLCNLTDSCVMDSKFIWGLHRRLNSRSGLVTDNIEMEDEHEIDEINKRSPWDVTLNVEMRPGKIGMILVYPRYAETNVRIVYRDSVVDISGDTQGILFKDDKIIKMNVYEVSPAHYEFGVEHNISTICLDSGDSRVDAVTELLEKPLKLGPHAWVWHYEAFRESGIVRRRNWRTNAK